MTCRKGVISIEYDIKLSRPNEHCAVYDEDKWDNNVTDHTGLLYAEIKLKCYDRFEGVQFMMMSRLDNDVTSSTGAVITTQKVLFCTFNSLCFKHFCVVVLHFYSNWHVKDLAMTSNHICG